MASEPIREFAEANGLAFDETADLPAQGPTLEAPDPGEVGAGASGTLPGGLEGTLAHFDYTTTSDGTTYHHEMTVVVTRVPETLGFAPHLRFDRGDSDLVPELLGTRSFDLRDDPALDGAGVHVYEGTGDGWLRELFSPALQDWLARSADDFGFQLSDGVLVVARTGHLTRQADLRTLCDDAAHVAGALRAEALEDAGTGGAEAAAAQRQKTGEDQMLANAMAAIELDRAPADVGETVPEFRRLISRSVPTWTFLLLLSLVFTVIVNIPLIVVPILLIGAGNWTALVVVEALFLGVILFFTARSHIRGNAVRYGAEAFFRGYARERGLTLPEPLVFAAAHAKAELPFQPERVLAGPIAGLGDEAAMIIRGDGSKREDGIALVAGPAGPVASAELRVSPRGISAADLDGYIERLLPELRV